MKKKRTPHEIARQNWERYQYVRDRGHRDYVEQARECERYYLGGGEQWSEEDRAVLESEGRPAEEVNLIMPTVNSAIGYQINNRVDIQFRPRGKGADEQTATVLSKVAMQVADNNRYRWTETQVFSDGLIERRGYFDIRIEFDDSMVGEVRITDLDPRDVLPDPDARSYDPDHWSDVIVTRWYTLDEIEWQYGAKARKAIEQGGDVPEDTDWGDDSEDEGRNRFGDNRQGTAHDAYLGETDGTVIPRYRVIDRQSWEMVVGMVAVYPTGDIRPVEALSMQQRTVLQSQGVMLVRKPHKRVRWTVSTAETVLFDELSPYNHFTVVPYFPFFRRGKTRGLVDNAISPQRVLNKAVSSYLHTISTTANSGWVVEENSLANMREEELEEQGSATGLVMVVRKGTQLVPTKIQPNQVPTGVDKVIQTAMQAVKNVTGINDAMMGTDPAADSGVAIQALQHVAQQQLAGPLDNLARTRHLIANRMLELIQGFYDDARVLRITETDPMGREQTNELPVNQPQPDGSILNDLTLGEYDVVVSEQPAQITFENSQFNQALELRKAGVAIPDTFVIRHSNLAEKQDIVEAMEQQQKPVDPSIQAKADLLKAQAVSERVKTLFSATEAAQNIAAIPQVAPLADSILGSAGFEDADAPPVMPPLDSVPGGIPEPVSGMRENTSPQFPPVPASPLRGIEGGDTPI